MGQSRGQKLPPIQVVNRRHVTEAGRQHVEDHTQLYFLLLVSLIHNLWKHFQFLVRVHIFAHEILNSIPDSVREPPFSELSYREQDGC